MFEIELVICIKSDLALNNQQKLICHKTQTTSQSKITKMNCVLRCLKQNCFDIWTAYLRRTELCYILTLDQAVNQRCSRVNKRKKKRNQVGVIKEYRQMPAAVESVGQEGQSENQLADWERPAGCCGPQRPPVEQPQARCGRSAKRVLEDNTACYGQVKKLGQYSCLSLSPLISHTPQKHQPFWE